MYLESYKELMQWLHEFPPGRQLFTMLDLLIPIGTEKGFLFSERKDDTPLKFIVFDDNTIVDGLLDIYRENVVIEFNVRYKKDISQKNYKMISHTNARTYGFYDFKNAILTITFKNGTELKLSKEDFIPYSKAYQRTLIDLIK